MRSVGAIGRLFAAGALAVALAGCGGTQSAPGSGIAASAGATAPASAAGGAAATPPGSAAAAVPATVPGTTLLAPGTPAPDFSAPVNDGTTVRLADLRGKPVILYFYPRDATPG
jgi:cytochrome oxidase Cu insertion factor (SCO1/SenC/PrrC family)